MAFLLAPTAVAAGYRLDAHKCVASTNALALEYAAKGDAGRLWVVATKQESGRGRRGRNWDSPDGNLAATLLLTEAFELRLAATLGFVAGLALVDALDAVMPRGSFTATGSASLFELKWPNDVLAGGAKMAGILLESSVQASGKVALAVGIGVNVVAHPKDVPYPATSLKAMGFRGDAEIVFMALSDAWEHNIGIWRQGEGLAEIRRLWLARAAGLGTEVSVNLGGEIIRGVFETIDDECRFIIRTAAGPVRIAAGDVHFGAVASTSAQ